MAVEAETKTDSGLAIKLSVLKVGVFSENPTVTLW